MYGDTDVMRKHVEPAARAGRRDPRDGRPARRPGRGRHLGRPGRRRDARAGPRARHPAPRGRRPPRHRRRLARQPPQLVDELKDSIAEVERRADGPARRRRAAAVRAARAGPQGLARGQPARRTRTGADSGDHRPRPAAARPPRPARRAAPPGRADPARAAVRRRRAPTAPRCPSTSHEPPADGRRPRRPARPQPRLATSRRRTPRRSASLHDPATSLSRRGLLVGGPDDGVVDEGIVGAIGLLATPTVAVDLDVAAGGVQVKSWHRQNGGAVAALSTQDGLVFELAWFPTWAWAAELARAAVVPEDLPLHDSVVPDRLDLPARPGRRRRSRPPAPTAPTSSRCWWRTTRARSPTATAASCPTAEVGPVLTGLATEARGRLRALVADVSGAETTHRRRGGLDAGGRRVAGAAGRTATTTSCGSRWPG